MWTSLMDKIAEPAAGSSGWTRGLRLTHSRCPQEKQTNNCNDSVRYMVAQLRYRNIRAYTANVYKNHRLK